MQNFINFKKYKAFFNYYCLIGFISRFFINKLFDSVDVDKGGEIDVKELNQMLEMVGITMKEDELKKIMKEYDTNDTSAID